MTTPFNVPLLIAGMVLLLLGWVLRRWAGRNSLMDKTQDAVWDAVKSRDLGGVRGHIEGTIGEITNEAGASARARKVAGMAAREASARVAAIAGLVLLLGGLILSATAFYFG